MNEIWINQFKGYSREDIGAYLDLLEGDGYRLYIPKTKALYEDELFDLSFEYVCMNWMAEQVHKLADRFLYDVPRLDQRTHFGFGLRTKDKAALAVLINDVLDLQDERSDRCEELCEQAYAQLGEYDKADPACYEYYVLACQLMVFEPGNGPDLSLYKKK